MGRESTFCKKPRIIDIDILLAGNTVIQNREIEIPHPRMEKRNFVLVPFSEISPETVHPRLNEKIKDLLVESEDPSVVKKISRAG